MGDMYLSIQESYTPDYEMPIFQLKCLKQTKKKMIYIYFTLFHLSLYIYTMTYSSIFNKYILGYLFNIFLFNPRKSYMHKTDLGHFRFRSSKTFIPLRHYSPTNEIKFVLFFFFIYIKHKFQ